MAVDFADLNLGVALMDAEHQELSALFHQFEECFQANAREAEAEAAVEASIRLANLHFVHEEAEMARTAYPKSAEHSFQHRNLRLQFTALMADTLAHARARDPVTLEHLDIMRQLIRDHILGPDSHLAAHIKAFEAAKVPEALEP